MTCSERLQAELQDDPGGGPPLIPVDPPDPPSSPREQDLTGIPYVHIYSSFHYNHFTLLKCYFTHIQCVSKTLLKVHVSISTIFYGATDLKFYMYKLQNYTI